MEPAAPVHWTSVVYGCRSYLLARRPPGVVIMLLLLILAIVGGTCAVLGLKLLWPQRLEPSGPATWCGAIRSNTFASAGRWSHRIRQLVFRPPAEKRETQPTDPILKPAAPLDWTGVLDGCRS